MTATSAMEGTTSLQIPTTKFRKNRPFNQNLIVGCMLFCLPGIYLALTGLGAGGGKPSSQLVASNTNAILYGLFTLTGCLGGSVVNLLKPKLTFVLGALGYPLYVGGLWYYDRTGHQWFPLFAGAVLGVSAGLLWTACGFIQLAYAEEQEKAMYISIQWSMNAAGGLTGAIIAFAVSINKTDATGASDPVFGAFVAIMGASIIVAFILIIKPEHVIRDDGRHLAIFRATDAMTELKGIARLFVDPKILIFIPGMIVAEMALALMSSLNGHLYNLRTRSLNNVLFQFVMVPLPLALAWIMDTRHIKKRRTRGLVGVTIIFVITVATYASLAAFLKLNSVDRTNDPPEVDWTDRRFAWGCVLHLLSAVTYAGSQICGQWMLGALTNDPTKCAYYAGLYKGMSSLGLMISFLMDGQGMSYQNQQITHLVLYVVGFGCLYWVCWFHITDTNYFLESDVIVPEHIEKNVLGDGEDIEHVEATQDRAQVAGKG